jgi:predicted secreted acid phosphatase
MNLNLNIKLEENKFYFGASNIFSKLLLLKNLLKQKKNFLIVVEDNKKALIYKKIAEKLDIVIDIIDNLSDFVDLVFNERGAFIVSKDFFNIDIIDKDFSKFSVKK